MAGGHISEQAPARGIETARPSWWFLLYRHVLAHKWVAAGLALALLAVGGLLVQSAFQVFSGQAAAGLRLALYGGLAGFVATGLGALPALLLRWILVARPLVRPLRL